MIALCRTPSLTAFRKSAPRPDGMEVKKRTPNLKSYFLKNILLSRYWSSRTLKEEDPQDTSPRFTDLINDVFQSTEFDECTKNLVDKNIEGNDSLSLDRKEWYVQAKKLLIAIVESNIGATHFTKFLGSHFDPQTYYIADIIKWIRGGRQLKITKVFQPNADLGIGFKGNTVDALHLGSPAHQAGVAPGWIVVSVNGQDVTHEHRLIDSIIAEANKKSDEIEIVFIQQGIKVQLSPENTYAPMQDAVLGLLMLSVMCDFLESDYWMHAKTEMEKSTVHIHWRILGKRVVIYHKKDTSSANVGILKRGAFLRGVKEGNWLHHSKGWSQFLHEKKTQIIQCRRRIKPISLPLLSESCIVCMKEASKAIHSNVANENWIRTITKFAQFLPIPITISDMTLDDHPLVYINQAFTDVTEYTSEEVLGKNCRFLQGNARKIPKNLMGRKVIREAFAFGEECYIHLLNYTKSNRLFHNLLAMQPIFDPITSNVRYVMGIQFDVGSSVGPDLMSPDLVILRTMNFLELNEDETESEYDRKSQNDNIA